MGYKNATELDTCVGNEGELIFFNHMLDKGMYVEYHSSKQDQCRYGDFIVGLDKDIGPHFNYEIKSRTGYYDDILYEVWADKPNKVKGWPYYLDSEVILYYMFLWSGMAYTCQIGLLREHVHSRVHMYHKMRPHQKLDRKSEFICIPIKELVEAGIVNDTTFPVYHKIHKLKPIKGA